MSKGKEKIIEVDNEVELCILPDLFKELVFNPYIPLENVSTSSIRENPKKMTRMSSSPFSESRSGKENSEEELSSGRTISVGGEKDIDEESSSEEEIFEETKPIKKRKLRHRIEADSYPIDYKFRKVYNIPNGIDLRIPGKGNTSSSASLKRIYDFILRVL